jgi:hypothetical protein
MPFAKDALAAGFSVGAAVGVVAGASFKAVGAGDGVAVSFSSLEQAAKPRAVLAKAIRTVVVNLCIRFFPTFKIAWFIGTTVLADVHEVPVGGH